MSSRILENFEGCHDHSIISTRPLTMSFNFHLQPSQKTVLFVRNGYYGLTSVDPDCLATITFMKLVDFNCQLKEVSSTSVSSTGKSLAKSLYLFSKESRLFVFKTGQLPVLCDGDNSISGSCEIIQYLTKKVEHLQSCFFFNKTNCYVGI